MIAQRDCIAVQLGRVTRDNDPHRSKHRSVHVLSIFFYGIHFLYLAK
uniref:Bm419 n=1 Tax=Brugia malayi TaxID=6279 RepID=A0A1I9GF37_BRUMA|nr:Bm419 [Brugia malayi]